MPERGIFAHPVLRLIRSVVLAVIDFLHRPFRRLINLQTFRYLFCGASNVGVDWAVWTIIYFFVVTTPALHIGTIGIERQVAASCISFLVSFPYGFMMSRYIVFPESNLGGRIQLFRYALTVAMCLLLTYLFIKMYAGFFQFPLFDDLTKDLKAILAKILTTATVAIFSYFTQRHFTFKVKETGEMSEEFQNLS